MTAGRHIVLESVADEYLERLAKRAEGLPVGDPYTEPVALGPLINSRQRDRVDRIVRDTVAAGAEVRAGGTHDGLFYRPTVLAGVTAAVPAFREEIFGPVAPVVVVRDEDEAVAVANDTEYGLVAAVQTGSPGRGRDLAQRLRTGIVHINDQTLNNDAYAPFGGTGASGNGARFGVGEFRAADRLGRAARPGSDPLAAETTRLRLSALHQPCATRHRARMGRLSGLLVDLGTFRPRGGNAIDLRRLGWSTPWHARAHRAPPSAYEPAGIHSGRPHRRKSSLLWPSTGRFRRKIL